ncbi:MAG: P-loop NTPase [Deltaproteobacteria bacterium]|nr:P-loop NTPase [Candidatus Anaeroferrophillacea bacterium]
MTATASPGTMTIREIAARLGLEESRLHYYDKLFAAWLPEKTLAGNHRGYPELMVEVFGAIHALKTGNAADEEIRADISARLQAAPAKRSSSPAAGRLGRILVITSGKGGVGKSSIAVNLAIELARRGRKTILVDGDLGLANLHILAGITPLKDIETMIRADLPLAEVITPGPGGIAFLAGASGISELADLPRYKRDRMIRELEKMETAAAHIIIDTGSGLNPGVLDFIRLADDLMVVATPDPTSLADAYGVIKTCAGNRFACRIGIFVNQVNTLAQAAAVFSRLEQCCQRFLSLPVSNLGCLYRDRSIEAAGRKRVPLLIDQVQGRAVYCLRQLGGLIAGGGFDIEDKRTPSFRRLRNLQPTPHSEDDRSPALF